MRYQKRFNLEELRTWTSKEVAHNLPAKDRLSILPARYALIPCSMHPIQRARSVPVSRSSPVLAQPPAGPDPDRDGWLRPGPTLGWSDRGNSTGGRDLVPAGGETLARRHGHYGHDAYRHSGAARRQDRRLDGTGQRRTVPQEYHVSRQT